MTLRIGIVVALLVIIAGYLGFRYMTRGDNGKPAEQQQIVAEPRIIYKFEKYALEWGSRPQEPLPAGSAPSKYSNIEPQDYVGAEHCGKCHAEKYKAWSQHPHRWMNASATPERVFGDFSGNARLRFQGGTSGFWREGDQFFMAAERGEVKRRYRITRTIGSRYFQYYVGVQQSGPEPAGDPRYEVDHVLPFGYWLRKQQWVPTVHIGEARIEDSDDPKSNLYEQPVFTPYDRSCAQCHTTIPVGDWLLRSPSATGLYSPYPLTINLSAYLHKRGSTPLADEPGRLSNEEAEGVFQALFDNRIAARIIHLGIQCEACHNGCKQHALAGDPAQTLPYFFPASPMIRARLPVENPYGRTHENVNWVCARCHYGGRPQFPGGINTWNSTEFTDATKGSCYSQLGCIDCHDAHKPTGLSWNHTPDWDDGKCLKCHQDYRAATARRGHTHHAPGSEGDRCMNCHMPRINEGLDQLVRTHTIFSPTKAALIEQNGPNACNLCHLEKPIDWTVGHLRDWYGRRYDDARLSVSYSQRQGPVGKGWLRHPFQATRLVAAASYGNQKRKDALPEILNILDDEYLLNRQFGQMAVEAIRGQALEKFGYTFTLSPQERAAILPRLRQSLGASNP